MRRGSAFSRTICGRESEAAVEAGIGAHIRPLWVQCNDISKGRIGEKEDPEDIERVSTGRGFHLVCRIIKAICSVVTASAAIIRSPSFSRSVESRTMMNSPFSKVEYNIH